MAMVAWLTMIALVGQPPVVGRPVDYSGAVGGPFVVQWVAGPTEVIAEEPLTLTLRIAGPGNLSEMPRPALARLESFRPFAVEDVDDRFVPGDTPRREFRYRVRPRTGDVKEIPRFKLVYFNPRIVPAARGYQTTYAEPVPLTVRPRTPPKPPDVPAWLIEEWDRRDEVRIGPLEHWRNELFVRVGLDPYPDDPGFPRPILAAGAVTMPILVCGIWYGVWCRRHPDAARLAGQRRSRAAAIALRELGRVTADDAGHVHSTLNEYLRSRAGLPATATTPAEVGDFLRIAGLPGDHVAAVEELLRRCDRARFSADHPTPDRLPADAEGLILDLEAAP